MNLLSKLVVSGLLCASLSAHAGLTRMTVHSRANCMNNETITWWKGHPHRWRVVSVHSTKRAPTHYIDTGFQYTWRSHAIHWGEGIDLGKWEVAGYHYDINYSKTIPFDLTYADSCNIIDGWI